MDQRSFVSSVFQTDLTSVGFSETEMTTYLFKKANNVVDTTFVNAPYLEPYGPTRIFPSQILTSTIPVTNPGDFTTVLTNSQIKSTFGLTDGDLTGYATTVGGVPQFSISQSVSYPYLYRVQNMLLSPYSANPNQSFRGTGAVTTSVNMLKNAIPFALNGTSDYLGSILRTAGAGVLSQSGSDYVLNVDLAYILDGDGKQIVWNLFIKNF